MKRRAVIISLILFSIISPANLMAMSGKVMLKGNVYGKNGNEPLDVSITFKTPEGKAIKTNSNSGKYELLLDAGVKYDVFINSKNTVRLQTEYIYNTDESYIEVSKDFHVSKIEEGAVLSHIKSAFTGDELNQKAQNEIDEVMKTLRFNRTIYLSFYVFDNNKSSDVAGNRLKSLEKYFENWKRYSNKIENTEAIEECNKINADESDIIVVISSVKDPFSK